MFLRVLLPILLLLPAPPAASQGLQLGQSTRTLGSKDLAFLAEKVRAEGFPCRRADRGVYLGQTDRGRRFRITCDGEKFTYRVEQRDRTRFLIEPAG